MPDTSDVESRVRTVIAKLFRLSPEQAQDSNLRIGWPAEWDSIGHMQLLVAVENEFDVRFPTHEIAGLITVDAIVNAVQANGAN